MLLSLGDNMPIVKHDTRAARKIRALVLLDNEGKHFEYCMDLTLLYQLSEKYVYSLFCSPSDISLFQPLSLTSGTPFLPAPPFIWQLVNLRQIYFNDFLYLWQITMVIVDLSIFDYFCSLSYNLFTSILKCLIVEFIVVYAQMAWLDIEDNLQYN